MIRNHRLFAMDSCFSFMIPSLDETIEQEWTPAKTRRNFQLGSLRVYVFGRPPSAVDRRLTMKSDPRIRACLQNRGKIPPR